MPEENDETWQGSSSWLAMKKLMPSLLPETATSTQEDALRILTNFKAQFSEEELEEKEGMIDRYVTM